MQGYKLDDPYCSCGHYELEHHNGTCACKCIPYDLPDGPDKLRKRLDHIQQILQDLLQTVDWHGSRADLIRKAIELSQYRK